MGYVPGQVLGGRTATLGGLTLGQVDTAGVAWALGREGLKGWSGPGVRTQYTDRAADHGAFAGPGYLAARVITLSGTVTAPDLAALDTAEDALNVAASLQDTLLVVSGASPRQAVVRRSGEVLWQPVTAQVAAYSVMVTAADPRRYSTTLQSASTGLPSTSGGLALPLTMPVTVTATTVAGSFTLTNAGSIGTRPVLTITGPVVNPTIVALLPSGAVQQLLYSSTLAAGDQLVIDANARTAVLNGTASRRRYLSGPWPEIPPGSSVTFSWTAASYNAAALLTGTCRSAWM